MDIDLLSKMVKELILDTDKVTLPGLGSFVAEMVPATFSDKGYTINPPYRRLYFRAKPDEGSELVAFYASSNDVELELADRIIRDFLSELKTVLHGKKIVVFPGLGRLRATKENNLFFVADEDLDIYPAGFGLEPISLKTHQESREQVAAAVSGLKSIISPSENVEPASASDSQPAEESVPVSEPEHPAEVTSEPEVVTEPETVVEPVESSEPVLEQEPEKDFIIVEVVPVEEPVKEAESEVVPVNEPVAVPEPVRESETMAPKAAVESDKVTATKPSAVRKIFKAVAWTSAIAAVLLVAFTVIARMNPGIMDTFLYTPEELEIVRTL